MKNAKSIYNKWYRISIFLGPNETVLGPSLVNSVATKLATNGVHLKYLQTYTANVSAG